MVIEARREGMKQQSSNITSPFASKPTPPSNKTPQRFKETNSILTGFRTGHSNLNQEDLRSTYCEAELAVIPSLYEGFGFAAIEAMACGVPLISSSGGALPEVIKDTGIIIPPKNVKEIYNVT